MIIPQRCTRIHTNTSYQPLTTFLRRTICDLGRWARRWKIKKVKNLQQMIATKLSPPVSTGGDNFAYTGTRPCWTYNNQIWRDGSCRRCNHLLQILSKLVKGFPSCEGPKLGVFHWLWQPPLQQVSTTVLPVIVPGDEKWKIAEKHTHKRSQEREREKTNKPDHLA